jgi:hypothetical protein
MPTPAPPRVIGPEERFRAYYSASTVEFHLLIPGELPTATTRLARFAREGGIDKALREAADAANAVLEAEAIAAQDKASEAANAELKAQGLARLKVTEKSPEEPQTDQGEPKQAEGIPGL